MFLHIDIDAFFASAECAVDPSLRGIPMAVGSRSNLEIFDRQRKETRLMNDNSGAFVAPVFYTTHNRNFESYFVDHIGGERKIRGIITSASYEARACGVKTAMPVAQALQLCPQMIVIPSHYRLYHTMSQKLYRFMQKKIPRVEQYSIDEFFGNLQGWVADEEVYSFALALQEEIKRDFALPVSIGIAKAKWIAKLATETAKPYGVYKVENIGEYIENIPIEAFPGIGKGFQKRLKEHHIRTLGELGRSRALLYRWKKPGIQLYKRVTGMDGEEISIRPPRKSIGISRTFDPIYDTSEIRRRMMVMARHISYMVLAINANPTSFYLRIGYEYGIRVKKYERHDRIFSERLYKQILKMMFDNIVLRGKGAVKLSLSVSNFTSQQRNTLSFLELHTDIKYKTLSKNIQQLRERFGIDIIKTGSEL
ncbi:DNA polymerase IV [hydrothermal vent metagenome]|uniref:DNA polymerase IV n=1 Tax=hydrothermal vent metagenome TaxID=652676 RepID=A0A1W1E932_9ZZZZ